MMSPRRLIVAAAGAALVTGIGVGAAFMTGAFEAASRTLALAGAAVWAGALVIMLAIGVLRFLRLQIALGETAPLETFNAAALHASASALIPGKLGELILPIVVRRLTGSSLLAGAGLLVFLRALDLAALTAVGCFAGILAGGSALLLGPLAVAALAAPFALHRLAKLTHGRQGRCWTVVARTADFAARFTFAQNVSMLALSLTVWIALWGAALLAAEGMGLDAPIATAGLAVAAASAAFASPVNGVANAGPFEAAFSGVYAGFGYSLAPALAAAVLLHVCAIAAPLLSLAVGEGAAFAMRVRPQPRALR